MWDRNVGIVKGILRSKQPKIYKQITKNCLNLSRSGSLLKQTEPESAKGQSTTRGGRIGNSCVVALLAASPAHSLSWPGVLCSEYYFFLATALLMRFFFLMFPICLWSVNFPALLGKVYGLCFQLFPGERNISLGLFKSSSILKMECL